jgi:penicillin-binding protein 1A
VTLRSALEHSRNVPTIKITDDLSIPTVLRFAERLGISAKLDDNLSLALGSFGISLMDIVTGYGVFANRGKILDAKSVLSITDRNGNTYELDENVKKNRILEKEKERLAAVGPTPLEEVKENPAMPEPEVSPSNSYLSNLSMEQVYDPRLAYIMTNLLRGVILHGTGRGAKEVSSFLAGKTGTTNNYVDAWFVGYSATVLTGVWVGNDDNSSMGHGETGSKSSLTIWREYMKAAIKKYGEYDFAAPSGIVNILIDKDTGLPAHSGEKNVFLESFVEGMLPDGNTPANFDAHQGAGDSSWEEDSYLSQ